MPNSQPCSAQHSPSCAPERGSQGAWLEARPGGALAEIEREVERVQQQFLLVLQARHHHDVERDRHDGGEEDVPETGQQRI